METYIQSCLHLETAAVLSGITSKMTTKWIELGRAGHPEFVAFVDMIDKANAQLSHRIMQPMTKAAFEDGNIQALQWIYKVRLAQREQHLQKKWLELEDKSDLPSEQGQPEEDVDAAEARALTASDGAEIDIAKAH